MDTIAILPLQPNQADDDDDKANSSSLKPPPQADTFPEDDKPVSSEDSHDESNYKDDSGAAAAHQHSTRPAVESHPRIFSNPSGPVMHVLFLVAMVMHDPYIVVYTPGTNQERQNWCQGRLSKIITFFLKKKMKIKTDQHPSFRSNANPIGPRKMEESLASAPVSTAPEKDIRASDESSEDEDDADSAPASMATLPPTFDAEHGDSSADCSITTDHHHNISNTSRLPSPPSDSRSDTIHDLMQRTSGSELEQMGATGKMAL